MHQYFYLLEVKITLRGALALLCVIGLALAARSAAAKVAPNIVFILADDMGYGDAGCYGQRLIATPSLDRMASEGMRFTQAYAGSPVCAPSRSVFMTGLHTGHTTVRGNFGRGGVVGLSGKPGRIPLRDEDVTVAEVLKQAGYTTGITGKWGLGEPSTTGLPTMQGFDDWFGYLNQRRAHSYYPDFLWLGEHRFDLVGNTSGARQQYSHDLFTAFALNFIRKNQSRPFFLCVPYTIPHDRFEVPDLGAYANKPWPEQGKTYAAMVSRMDNHVGRILDCLAELDIDRNTVVFFSSDNGAANRYDGLFNSSGDLRGQKRDLYEGGIRTPLIARWPGSIAPGVTSDSVCYFADVLPTLAEIAGAPEPAGLDGFSIAPELRGEKTTQEPRFLYWEFFERGFQQAARWGDWKYLRLAVNQPAELYNLAEDEGEENDIAAENSAVVAMFEEYLATARTESESFPRVIIQDK